ncbi:LD-carboxypeptidase [Psychrobacter maritimus]|uniref:LD-carboxypeptidase n=1 Tax=Psychrobacter maritimus TaxID=256325 RepID=UPI001D116F89|nr:LD-carboxypeptidase [Psychrobacter maritimus]
MVSKSQLLKNAKSKDAHTANDTTSGLNRRQFLRQVGISAGAGLLVTQSMTQALAANTIQQDKSTQLTKDDLPTALMDERLPSGQAQQAAPETLQPNTRCITPNIETRLFASSNVGGSDERNELALDRMACAGFKVDNSAITKRQYLRFSGTDSQRASDLQNIATGAIKAPKLLLGVRGGYGAVRLLPMVDWSTLGRIMKERGSILAGFSDVTAIQCALLAKGEMSSLAAPMLYSEFGKNKPDQVSCRQFAEALTNPNLAINIQDASLTSPNLPSILATSEPKTLTGTIWGGNLSVVSALAGSDYLPRIDGGIVFLEDVGEQAYRIERMLYDLYLAGVFKNQQAIVFGALSGSGEDSYDKRYDVATVIRQLHKLTGLPIYNGMRFGHIGQKHSFPLGATCQLSANTIDGYQLAFSGYPIIKSDAIRVEGLWQ